METIRRILLVLMDIVISALRILAVVAIPVAVLLYLYRHVDEKGSLILCAHAIAVFLLATVARGMMRRLGVETHLVPFLLPIAFLAAGVFAAAWMCVVFYGPMGPWLAKLR